MTLPLALGLRCFTLYGPELPRSAWKARGPLPATTSNLVNSVKVRSLLGPPFRHQHHHRENSHLSACAGQNKTGFYMKTHRQAQGHPKATFNLAPSFSQGNLLTKLGRGVLPDVF